MADDERSEPFEQLEERVNRRVQEALSGLQQEIRDRLKKAGDQLVGELDRELGDVASGLPTSFLPREELEPLTAEAEDAGRRQLLGHLVAAFSAVDRAGTQRAILDSLIEEGRRFADRTAVLLTRDDGYHLWGAGGWGSEVPSDVSLPWGAAGAWSVETVGSGAVALAANDCAPLCSRLDGAVPENGLLVPLILRDRLAAVVYADHDGGAFFAEALQALTWAAALALEALPFRDRAATPTLHPAGAAAAAPLLEPMEGGEATAAEPEPAAEEPETAEPEAFDVDELEIVEPEAAELELEEEPAPAFADDLGDDAVELELDSDDEDWGLEAEEPSSDVGELEISEPEEDDGGLPEPPTWEAPTLDAEGDEGGAETGEAAETVPGEAEELVIEEFDDAVDGDLYAGGEDEEAGDEVAEEVEEAEEATAAPAAEAVEEGEEPRIAGFERAHTEPAAAGEAEEAEGDEAAPEEAAAEPPPLETAAAPIATAPGGASEGSPQVAPPTDHSGPGLAFSGDESEEEGDGARHEEARRLARLLVSEIRLYNEDLVEEGRRNQDIYQRLKEDIDRSRQIYEERIDAGLREGTDYFYEELVRNLGGGDAGALGI